MQVGGVPLVLHVARILEPVVSRVSVVADRPGKYEALGVRTIGDPEPHRGPLAGIVTALRDAAGEEWAFIAPCDWLGIRAEWVSRLAAHRTGARAVAFRHEVWEPLFALYRTDLLSDIGAALARGDPAPWRLLEEVRATAVSPPEDFDRRGHANSADVVDAWLASNRSG